MNRILKINLPNCYTIDHIIQIHNENKNGVKWTEWTKSEPKKGENFHKYQNIK